MLYSLRRYIKINERKLKPVLKTQLIIYMYKLQELDNFYAIKGSEIIAYANYKGMIDYYLQSR